MKTAGFIVIIVLAIVTIVYTVISLKSVTAKADNGSWTCFAPDSSKPWQQTCRRSGR